MIRNFCVTILCISMIGCAAPDDLSKCDPGNADLFTYWKCGETSYQQRLDEKQNQLGALEEQGQTERDRSEALEKEKYVKMQELRFQTELLNEIDSELEKLKQAAAKVQTDTEIKKNYRQTLAAEIENLKTQLQKLKEDPTNLALEKIKERRQKIEELKAEITKRLQMGLKE